MDWASNNARGSSMHSCSQKAVVLGWTLECACLFRLDEGWFGLYGGAVQMKLEGTVKLLSNLFAINANSSGVGVKVYLCGQG